MNHFKSIPFIDGGDAFIDLLALYKIQDNICTTKEAQPFSEEEKKA